MLNSKMGYSTKNSNIIFDMKKTLLISAFIGLISLSAYTQNFTYAVPVGGSIELNVTGANGSVQWQESTDSISWSNLSGGTSNPFTFSALASATGKRHFRAQISNISICENAPWYSQAVTFKIISSTNELQIGDWYAGGLVYYTNGTNGWLTPSVDQSENNSWGCQSTHIATAESTTDGASNTMAILNNCSERPIAASVCSDLVLNGYSDWYLPASGQLLEMSTQRAHIGYYDNSIDGLGHYSGKYWSSTDKDFQSGTGYAGYIVIAQDYQPWVPSAFKDMQAHVRCSRTYSASGTIAVTSASVSVISQPQMVSIISHPTSRNLCKGVSTQLACTATGSNIVFQWKKNGDDIIGANTNRLTINPVNVSDEGVYTCVVGNDCKMATSNAATVNVIDIQVNAGNDLTFCNSQAAQLEGTASSNHESISGTLNYTWTPSTGLNFSNISNPTAQPTVNTTYILRTSDALSCFDQDTLVLTSISPAVIQSQDEHVNVCLNSTAQISLTALGTNINYQWYKASDALSNEHSNLLNITTAGLADEGFYYCELSNFCGTINSNQAELKVIELNANAGPDFRLCLGQEAQILASVSSNHPEVSANIGYLWNHPEGLSNDHVAQPLAHPNTTTEFALTASDELGCTATDLVEVTVGTPYQNETICLVSVDPISGKNKIMWEKTAFVGTQTFKIMKESGTNNYIEIGEVESDLPAEYTDLSSMPDVHSDKYKLMLLDTCGNESNLSPYHKTVNLVLSFNANTIGLSWTPYFDESGSFIPTGYYIYRGETPSNLSLLDSVSGSILSYNDVNVYQTYYYMIGVRKADGCQINGTPSTLSYSNQQNNSAFVGITQIKQAKHTVEIMPNPMHEQAEILWVSENTNETSCSVKIYTVSGQMVRNEVVKIQKSGQSNLVIIKRNELQTGLYHLVIEGETVGRAKLIVE